MVGENRTPVLCVALFQISTFRCREVFVLGATPCPNPSLQVQPQDESKREVPTRQERAC